MRKCNPEAMSRPGTTQTQRRDEGVALLLALLFVILLSAIVVEYCYEMQVEATLVSGQSDELQAYVASKSAIAAAMSLIATSQQSSAAGPVIGPSQPSPGQGAADTLLDPWALGISAQSINEAVMQASIKDEYGKLNLNALIDPDTDQPRENVEKVLRALFRIRKVDQDPTDAIIDWLDANEETQGSNGAESDTYQSLTVPYSCKNGPMSSIEELLLIKGITPIVYFGDPDQNQLPLSDLLTVHGDPKGRVNINTAAKELLDAMGEGLDDGQTGLGDLVESRQMQDPFTSKDAVTQALTGYGNAAKQMLVSSKVFRIYGDGQMGETDPVRVRTEAYVARKSGVAGSGFTILDWRVIR